MMKSYRLLRSTLLMISASLVGVMPVMAGTLSPAVATKALKAKKLADKKHYDKAIEVLTPLPKQAYDKAYMARMLGIFYWQNEQIKPAIKALRLAVSGDQLEPEQAWSTRRMLADILLMNQQYKPALTEYSQLVKTQPKSKSHEDKAELWCSIDLALSMELAKEGKA